MVDFIIKGFVENKSPELDMLPAICYIAGAFWVNLKITFRKKGEEEVESSE